MNGTGRVSFGQPASWSGGEMARSIASVRLLKPKPYASFKKVLVTSGQRRNKKNQANHVRRLEDSGEGVDRREKTINETIANIRDLCEISVSYRTNIQDLYEISVRYRTNIQDLHVMPVRYRTNIQYLYKISGRYRTNHQDLHEFLVRYRTDIHELYEFSVRYGTDFHDLYEILVRYGTDIHELYEFSVRYGTDFHDLYEISVLVSHQYPRPVQEAAGSSEMGHRGHTLRVTFRNSPQACQSGSIVSQTGLLSTHD
ncbi:hypothetical protein RRG08_032729 [Elysia crispata]|uniref:Uncharacterized protein n=1 Tax=Elysia crispata TaxID=231223 RepID=A0AAE0YUH1_9GAST|nr:hypothetical protein RRG08_032729 [Elysia crispata]